MNSPEKVDKKTINKYNLFVTTFNNFVINADIIVIIVTDRSVQIENRNQDSWPSRPLYGSGDNDAWTGICKHGGRVPDQYHDAGSGG